MSDGDIHNYGSRLKNRIETIKHTDKTSEHNKQLLLDFNNYMSSQGLSEGRIARYLYSWLIFLPHIDFDIDKVSKKQLIKLVGKINQDKIKDKELAEQTKREYKKAIKKFYTDFMESRESDFKGGELCDFFTLTVKESYLDPDRLPTPIIVAELVNNARNPRDKALLMTLWSTAGRIGEILGLKWKDVIFNSDIAKVKFRDTKTGGDRLVPVHVGYVYLKNHKENDPKSSDPEEFVFRGLNSDTQLKHSSACQIINRVRERTDIPDRIKTKF